MPIITHETDLALLAATPPGRDVDYLVGADDLKAGMVVWTPDGLGVRKGLVLSRRLGTYSFRIVPLHGSGKRWQKRYSIWPYRYIARAYGVVRNEISW